MRPWRLRCCFTRQRGSVADANEFRASLTTMNLFRAIEPEESAAGPRPLADRMRPQTLDELMGQDDLLGPGKPLRTQIERDEIVSMLFWGPPGCGKTTLARLIAKKTRSEFVPFSAVMS